MSHSVSESTKALLTGGLTGPQQAIEKAKQPVDPDMVALHAQDALVIAQAAHAVVGGKQVDKGSALVDDLRTSHFASSITSVKARRSKITTEELERELGHPDLGGPESVAACLRINRRGEPAQGGN
jgi:hypothetical protein